MKGYFLRVFFIIINLNKGLISLLRNKKKTWRVDVACVIRVTRAMLYNG